VVDVELRVPEQEFRSLNSLTFAWIRWKELLSQQQQIDTAVYSTQVNDSFINPVTYCYNSVEMTRDAVTTMLSQRPQNGRRMNRSGRRGTTPPQAGGQSDATMRPLPATEQLSNSNAMESSPLPQLRQSPSKKSPNQYSQTRRNPSGHHTNLASDANSGVMHQTNRRNPTNYSPSSFLPQPYFAAAASVLSSAHKQRGNQSSTFFAGSKFGDAPSPTILPPPPPHWLGGSPKTIQRMEEAGLMSLSKEDHCIGLTSGLKVLLHVQ
jgi:hypothetical protein